MPEVSIVIPTYNRADLLPRAINSVLQQDYEDYELIVVDDGSTDNTEQVVRGYQDRRIQYVKLPTNSGASSKPRNVGILRSRGKYIALLDSDDEWLPEYLSKLVSRMAESSSRVGIVYCGLIVMPLDGGHPHIMHSHRRGKVYPDSLSNIICSMSSSLIRSQCFKRIGMFDESPFLDHGDMVIRLSKVYEFDYVEEALAKYHYHTNQRTRHLQPKWLKNVLNRYAQDFADNPDQAGVARLTLGVVLLREGHIWEAVRYIGCNLRYLRRLFIDYGRTNQMSMKDWFTFMRSFASRINVKAPIPRQRNILWLGAMVDSLYTALPLLSVVNFLAIQAVLYTTVAQYIIPIIPWFNFGWFISIMVVITVVAMLLVFKFIIPSLWTWRGTQLYGHQSVVMDEIRELRKEVKEIRDRIDQAVVAQ